MTIKIRFHGDTATIRWKNSMEKQFMINQMTIFRDAMGGRMPILLKDDRGDEIPKMKIPSRPIAHPPIIKDASGMPKMTAISGEVNTHLAEAQPAVVVRFSGMLEEKKE